MLEIRIIISPFASQHYRRSPLNNPLLLLLVFVVAVLYSSAGFGGASGYLLAMSFFDIPANVMSSTALVLNIFVSTISFTSYFRAGHFRLKLLIPFLIASIPAAFLGGTFKLTEQTYSILLYAVLTYLALRMTFFPVLSDKADWTSRPVPLWAALTSGAAIGFLSGMIGIGGGIFLSPLIASHHPLGLGQFQTSRRIRWSLHRHQLDQRSGRALRQRNVLSGRVWDSASGRRFNRRADRKPIGRGQIFRRGCAPRTGFYPYHCRGNVLV